MSFCFSTFCKDIFLVVVRNQSPPWIKGVAEHPEWHRQSFSLMYSFADLYSPIYPLTLLTHPLKGPLTHVLNMLSVQLCVGMLVDGSSSLQSFGTILVFLQRDSDCAMMIVRAALCCVWQVFDFLHGVLVACHQWTHQSIKGFH